MAVTQYAATGRRKSSVARVRLVPGNGKFVINGRNFAEYITSAAIRLDVLQPLTLTDTGSQYDVYVNVNGGGVSGQAGAIYNFFRLRNYDACTFEFMYNLFSNEIHNITLYFFNADIFEIVVYAVIKFRRSCSIIFTTSRHEYCHALTRTG